MLDFYVAFSLNSKPLWEITGCMLPDLSLAYFLTDDGTLVIWMEDYATRKKAFSLMPASVAAYSTHFKKCLFEKKKKEVEGWSPGLYTVPWDLVKQFLVTEIVTNHGEFLTTIKQPMICITWGWYTWTTQMMARFGYKDGKKNLIPFSLCSDNIENVCHVLTTSPPLPKRNVILCNQQYFAGSMYLIIA